MIDWVSAAGNILQLGLTVTFCGLVVYLNKAYGPTTLKAFRSKEPWTAPTWLAVGITVGFNFNALDWGYWAVTWLAVLFQLDMEETMFKYGPVSNLFLRQMPSIYSIYCHLVAVKMLHGGGPVKLKEMLLLGTFASGILWALKWEMG